jgi:hypothetical protein
MGAVAGLFIGLFVIGIVAAVYFLPWLVAIIRKHPNCMAIFLLNFFLGWTIIGWLGALIWSCLAIDKSKAYR